MVINACLAKGSAAMGKKQTVVKNINAMQGFGSMDILCVDKTGTLTGDKISLEYYMDVLGNESTGGSGSRLSEQPLSHRRQKPSGRRHPQVRGRCPGACCALFRNWRSSIRKLDELPFDYERRFASVLVQRRGGKPADHARAALRRCAAGAAASHTRASCTRIGQTAWTASTRWWMKCWKTA